MTITIDLCHDICHRILTGFFVHVWDSNIVEGNSWGKYIWQNVFNLWIWRNEWMNAERRERRVVPRPLAPLVGQRNVDHTHQRFLKERPVGLPVVLLQDLAAAVWTHRQNQAPAGLQLLQELKDNGKGGKKTTPVKNQMSPVIYRWRLIFNVWKYCSYSLREGRCGRPDMNGIVRCGVWIAESPVPHCQAQFSSTHTWGYPTLFFF